MSDASVSTTEDRRTARQSMTRSTIENKKDYVSKTTSSAVADTLYLSVSFHIHFQIKVGIKEEKVLSVE